MHAYRKEQGVTLTFHPHGTVSIGCFHDVTKSPAALSSAWQDADMRPCLVKDGLKPVGSLEDIQGILKSSCDPECVEIIEYERCFLNPAIFTIGNAHGRQQQLGSAGFLHIEIKTQMCMGLICLAYSMQITISRIPAHSRVASV